MLTFSLKDQALDGITAIYESIELDLHHVRGGRWPGVKESVMVAAGHLLIKEKIDFLSKAFIPHSLKQQLSLALVLTRTSLPNKLLLLHLGGCIHR